MMKKCALSIFIACLFMLSLSLKGLSALQNKEISRLAPGGVKQRIPYNVEDLKDPFVSYIKEGGSASAQPVEPLEPELPLPALSVQGVIWGGRIPQAIINDQVLKAGDTIAGVTIAEINKDGIKVIFQNRPRNLPAPSAGDRPKDKDAKERK